MEKISSIKNNFPLLFNQPGLVYLDNSASTQTPAVVLDATNEYYTKYRANIHRGQYTISEIATEAYEAARTSVAGFLNTAPEEIIFTSGATHGLNLLAYSLCSSLKPGDNVVLTRTEHHANLIPWVQMSKKYGFEVRYIELCQKPAAKNQKDGTKHFDYVLDLNSARDLIDESTKVVSVAHISNVLGTINPIEEITGMAHKVGAIMIVDAAQSAAHLPIDVKKIDCDALVFSGHKMYGPTGIGAVYIKKELQERMPPLFFGGNMILDVTYENATWNEPPHKFEAGTPNIAGAIGLAAAVEFIENIGWGEIQKHEQELTAYTLNKLSDLSCVQVIGIPEANGRRVGVISFITQGIHFHDIATVLANQNVCIRAGHHCAMPLMRYLGIQGTSRVSFGVYNSIEDIDKCIAGVEQAMRIFHRCYDNL